MRATKERIAYLLGRYSEGKITPDEERELFGWVNEADEYQVLEEHISALLHRRDNDGSVPSADWDRLYKAVSLRAEIKRSGSTAVRMLIRVAAAACILLVIGLASYYFLLPSFKSPVPAAAPVAASAGNNDVHPGRNGAVLTLDDGRTIVLDSASDGILSLRNDLHILKKDGALIYNTEGQPVGYNTMSTPAGRQYSLTLSDGTKVWLNASSSIRFPTSFSGPKREVSVTGEAYFEVARNTSVPFVVKIRDNNEVVVLGTHFNINAYDNEGPPRTTLLEGKVRIVSGNASAVLNPGEQARTDAAAGISINTKVDVEEVVAWKNGMFLFNRTPADEVMRQLARWYDVDVEYKEKISRHFGGAISRNVNLSQVLKMLELTGEMKFTIQDKKIIVSPVN